MFDDCPVIEVEMGQVSEEEGENTDDYSDDEEENS